MPRFVLFHRSQLDRSLTLDKDEILIGRMPGIDVELLTTTVSRRHARILRTPEGWAVEDLGSTNGVFVQNHAVTRHDLRAGDNIRIEDYTLVFEPPDDLYAAGLQAGHEDPASAQRWSATYLSASRFLTEEPTVPDAPTGSASPARPTTPPGEPPLPRR